MVDLTDGRVTVRRSEMRRGVYRPGPVVAEFALAQAEAIPHQGNR
jgi:hypothetical protein